MPQPDKIDRLLELSEKLATAFSDSPPATAAQVQELGSKMMELDADWRQRHQEIVMRLGTHDEAIDSLRRKVNAPPAAMQRSTSPFPRRYDLTLANVKRTPSGSSEMPPGMADELVKRLNELEQDSADLRQELDEKANVLARIQAEAQAAKVAEQRAQERQAAVTEYANKLEAKAKAEKEEAEKRAAEAEKKARSDKEFAEQNARAHAAENRRRIKWWLGIAVMVGSSLGGIVNHYLEARPPQAPSHETR